MGPDKILLAATIAAGISGTGTALGIPHAPAVAERSPTDSIPSFPMGGFASVCSQLTIDARTGWYYLFAKCCASDGKSDWSNFALDWALATNDDGMLVGMQK